MPMNVTLPPELEQFVSQKVESGQYLCESEVILEALRLLRERDELDRIRLEALRKEIAIGIEQLERGEYTEYDEVSLKAMFEQLRSKARQKLTEQGKNSQA